MGLGFPDTSGHGEDRGDPATEAGRTCHAPSLRRSPPARACHGAELQFDIGWSQNDRYSPQSLSEDPPVLVSELFQRSSSVSASRPTHRQPPSPNDSRSIQGPSRQTSRSRAGRPEPSPEGSLSSHAWIEVELTAAELESTIVRVRSTRTAGEAPSVPTRRHPCHIFATTWRCYGWDRMNRRAPAAYDWFT